LDWSRRELLLQLFDSQKLNIVCLSVFFEFRLFILGNKFFHLLNFKLRVFKCWRFRPRGNIFTRSVSSSFLRDCRWLFKWKQMGWNPLDFFELRFKILKHKVWMTRNSRDNQRSWMPRCYQSLFLLNVLSMT